MWGRHLFNLKEIIVTAFQNVSLVHEAWEYQGEIDNKQYEDLNLSHLTLNIKSILILNIFLYV